METPTLSKAGSAWNKGQTWESKNLTTEQIKNYLNSQQVVIAEGESAESKLKIKKVQSVSGTASIAVVRGEPKMGYELTLKVELVGVEGTFLEGLEATLEVEGLVEYDNEPDSFDFEV